MSVKIFAQTFAKLPPHREEIEDAVVGAGSRTLRGSPERRFQSVGVKDSHHPCHHPGRSFFAPLHSKFTIPKAELEKDLCMAVNKPFLPFCFLFYLKC